MIKCVTVRAQTFAQGAARVGSTLLLAGLCLVASVQTALAQVAPTLGTAGSFAVLGAETVTNTGPTIITGDLGVSPGAAITGFPPGLVAGGATHAADAVASQAQSDTTIAYNSLAGQACNFDLTGQDLGGMTLVPGVYCFSSSAQLTGALVLDAGGDPSAVWIFQIGSTLTTASHSSVMVVNGGQQCNVFWQIGSSATVGTGSAFLGNILALTSITLTTNVTVTGRALAQNGAVTLDSNTISVSGCAVPTITPIPPTVGKAFSAATIEAGGLSTLTITLGNADASAATLTAPLTDSLPSGVVVAGAASTSCIGGIVEAPIGGSMVTLTAGSIPANGSCTVTVDVTAPAAGTFVNALPAGALQTGNGSNATPAVATLTVNAPATVAPTLAKAFSPATINAGGTSTLTITLTNTSATAATLTAPLVDTLPSGMVVSDNTASTTCGGAVTAAPGSSTVTLVGGSIPANGACTVTVDVTATVGGNLVNSLAAGALQTSNGNNPGPAIATLTVIPAPIFAPTLGKAFSPASISAGGVSTLTITLSNTNNTVALMTAPLTDALPGGLTVASSGSTTCGGVLTAVVGSSTVTLTGGSIPANGFCTVTVPVTAPAAGTFVNMLPAGALQTNKGTNAGPAVATLVAIPIVVPAPGLSLTKTPNTTTYTSVGQVIMYTYVIKNTADVPLSGPFTVTDDKLGTFACGAAATLAPGASVTCTKSYTIQAANLGNVTGLPTGVLANIDTGAWLQGVGSTQSTTITGAGPLVPNGVYPGWCIQDRVPTDLHNQPAKLYSTTGGSLPADVASLSWKKVNYALNHKIRGAGNSDLKFFKDVQTAIWVLLGEPNPEFGISASAQQMINEANAHATFVPGPGDIVAVIVYSDGMKVKPGSIQESIVEMRPLQTIVNRATGSGKFGTVLVTSSQVQATVNQTMPVANIPPTLKKVFTPSSIPAGGTSTLVITLTNPNGAVATLTAPLIDAFPAGLVVAGSGITTCGGTVTAVTGATKVTLTGGAIPANGSCTVTVKVTAPHAVSCENKLPVGALQTTKGKNTVQAVATLTVVPATVAPKLAKSFNPAAIKTGGVSTLLITLTNPNGSAASLTAPLTDSFPSGLLVSGYASTTCGGTLTATTGAAKVTLTGGAIPANSSCTISVKVTARNKGSYSNMLPVGALQTTKGNSTVQAVATLTVSSYGY